MPAAGKGHHFFLFFSVNPIPATLLIYKKSPIIVGRGRTFKQHEKEITG
jgi:hypothetical protein